CVLRLSQENSALGKRNGLPVIVGHVFDFDRRFADTDDFVAAIDDVAFTSDKDIFPLGKKNACRLARPVGESIELQINRRRRWRRRRRRRRVVHYLTYWLRGLLLREFKNIASCAFVIGALDVLQSVETQCRIKAGCGGFRALCTTSS